MKKQTWLQRGAAVAAAMCMATTLCACTSSPDNNGETTTTATDAQTTVVSGTTTSSKTTTTTKKTTTTTKKATTTTKKPTTTQVTTQATTQTVATQPPTTPAPTMPTATNPQGEEILGVGSKDQPYLEHPSENMTVTTVSIPAGRSLFYNIYRVGGMVLTINNSNAYVVYDGTRYNANGGSVSFQVGSALASDAISFEIGNSGSSATSFTLQFSNTTGSYMNPVSVSRITDKNKVSLAEGADAGYYYKYYAEKSGKLRLYMTASVESMMFATNNRNSAQRSTEEDAQTDAQGTYIEIEVQQGDEILINVAAKPNRRGKYPATEITWNGKYV